MISVFKGLKIRVAAAVISAILFYGVLTLIVSAPAQPLAVRKALTTLCKMTTPSTTSATSRTERSQLSLTVTKTLTTTIKPHAEIGAEAYKGITEREGIVRHKMLLQNLIISVAIGLLVMAIFKMRMR